MHTDDLERILGAAETLSDSAAHRLAMSAGSDLPCLFPQCNLSMQEHHRLAYGILAENRDLKRRIEALEHGPAEPEEEEKTS